MKVGETVKLGGSKMTVAAASEKAVRLEAHGWRCWFPKKALLVSDDGFVLADWFRADEYCQKFFNYVERKEAFRKGAEKTFHIEVDDDGNVEAGWRVDGAWMRHPYKGSTDAEDILRLADISISCYLSENSNDWNAVVSAFNRFAPVGLEIVSGKLGSLRYQAIKAKAA